jgi:hypothetical protein
MPEEGLEPPTPDALPQSAPEWLLRHWGFDAPSEEDYREIRDLGPVGRGQSREPLGVKMRERMKLRRPSHSTVVAYLALFVALGGSAYAVGNLGKNTVGSKQLKKNAVTTAKVKKEAITAAKVKKGTLTGTHINASTLGIVPTAQTAQTANALGPSEAWHLVGAPGEPGFLNDWENAGVSGEAAAYYKDHEGIVHLKGSVIEGTKPLVFVLPPGYRPANNKLLNFPVACFGFGCASGVGSATVRGTGAGFADAEGGVAIPGDDTSLNGISFRAES